MARLLAADRPHLPGEVYQYRLLGGKQPHHSVLCIDSEGIHLRIGQGLWWLPFAAPCNTPIQVREALVSLARANYWPGREAVPA